MQEFVFILKEDNLEGCFLRAVLCVHHGDSINGAYWIEKCREFLDFEFSLLIDESYEQLYPLIVKSQQLVELEEILTYKEYDIGNNNSTNNNNNNNNNRNKLNSKEKLMWDSR